MKWATLFADKFSACALFDDAKLVSNQRKAVPCQFD